MQRTRKLALAAMLAALAVVFLYLTGVLPTGGIGVSAMAAICTSIVYLECGLGYAVGHYALAGLLGFLLVPVKTYVLWYILAFGHYGILKLLIEKLPNRAAQWGLKAAAFGASMAALLLGVRVVVAPNLPLQGLTLWAVLLVVFVVYDIGVSGVLAVYRRRVRRAR